MNRKRLIRKVLTALFWLLTGTGMIVLLVAANRPEQGHVVREVRISIKGDGEQFFIDKSDILLQLTKSARSALVGRSLDRLNLARLEASLEKGVWIREAELWIDSRDVLHVQVTEREPVARVFTTAGASFYIDSSGQRMPLLEKESARVLVVTNYPGSAHFNRADSLRAADVKALAVRLTADPFWKEQIAQVDLTPSGLYEAIPVVGNHVIRLGDAQNLDAKLARLLLFYRKVLAKNGLDKYTVIDVQYAGQVLGVQRGPVSAVDSLQLQRNIQDLLDRSQRQMQEDSLAAVQVGLAADTARSHGSLPIDSIATQPEPATPAAEPAPVRRDTAQKRPGVTTANPATHRAVQPVRQPAARPQPTPLRVPAATGGGKPRAVMPARPKPPKRTTNEY
ncbi:cell division protein FtsQ/DivIB [Flaviaesturariibacter terrae]